jgi:glutathione S-transferase
VSTGSTARSDFPKGLARLVTMPHSHYCEKARWALDRLGIAYVEEPHAPLFHWVATRHARGRRTVPVLVTADGRVHADSTDILVQLDASEPGRLYPCDVGERRRVLELEDYFDEQFGPHVRRWGYAHLLGWPGLRDLASRGVPALERALLPLVFPLATAAIRRVLQITPASVARSHERVIRVFAEVTDLLRDGRPYLGGDRLTAADITFAALAGPALLPDGYRGTLPRLDAAPRRLYDDVLRFRATLAGQYVQRLFLAERSAERIASS